MSEQDVPEKVEQPETTSADFEAGFSGTPTATPEKTEPAQSEQLEQKVEQPEQQQTQQEPKYRQITEDEFNKLSTAAAAVEELKATVGKQFDTAFGKMGGLERVLKEFQAKTPTGQAVEVTAEDFAEMKAEYPEIADMQLKAFQRIAGKLGGTGGYDESRVQQTVNPLLEKVGKDAVATAKLEIAEETLDETHPGWAEIVGAPDETGKLPDNDYHKWLASQPDEYKTRVLNSYSPVVIGRSIDKFQEHQKALKQQADSKRRDRFDQAVTPKGDGGHEPSENLDDAFNEGFNKARG